MKTAIKLDDKFTEDGRVYLTANQALVRLPLMQGQRDRSAGLNTAGYITGYRGSPIGVYDTALWNAADLLAANHIRFQPGVNEELALTAIRGTQWLHYYPQKRYDGVFALWYAKNLGVDRAFEVMRQANLEGTAPHGGVLVVGADDVGAKSTVTATASDPVWRAALMPILYPSNAQEYLDYGLLGFAMSRYSGLYVGFKVVTDTIEVTATVDVDPGRSRPLLPADFAMPPGGVNKIRGDIAPLPIERRMIEFKLPAAIAFAKANRIDRVIFDSDRRELGIVAAGKPYEDLREALNELGLDAARLRRLGIRLYKLGMIFPIEPDGLTAFAGGCREILVVEEKFAFIEDQITALLYHLPASQRPRITGKQDQGGMLIPAFGETSVHLLTAVLSRRIEALELADAALAERIAAIRTARAVVALPPPSGLMRTAFFCSGCPHNTSTRTVDGSLSFAGVGCHGLAAMFMPDRPTEWSAQMGGEGMLWAGLHAFVDIPHAFQNLGDGTYFHSAILAIRAAVASGAAMTYKLLYNDAVAMTGGQPVDGTLTVEAMANQVFWEGVKPIVIVTDEPEKYPSTIGWPDGTTVRHRRELEQVQREMQRLPGISALIYDQTCAAEKRRRRKRGRFPDPDRRLFINQDVCEGCGDCTKKSNCVSIEPLETEFGRKRKINQSSCNKDYSCQEGFCPSFVSVLGGRPRRGGTRRGDAAAPEAASALFASLPAPPPAPDRPVHNLLVTGIGGTGVLTVAAIAGMAAHIDGKSCSVMDMTGMAQKGGGVLSHIRIADDADRIHATRLWQQSADAVIGCDLVVTASAPVIDLMRRGTRVMVNSDVTPTAQFQANAAIDLGPRRQIEALAWVVGAECVDQIGATGAATSLTGDSIGANMFMLGYAVQKGFVPLTVGALEQAIRLNNAQVALSLQVFGWGRLAAHDPIAFARHAPAPGPASEPSRQTLDDLITHRSAHLTAWGDAAWARRYTDFVGRVRAREQAAGIERLPLTEAVACNLSKLMSYKDEYEVGRLYAGEAFRARLAEAFEGDLKLRFHLSPPTLIRQSAERGEPRKIVFGGWMLGVFAVLARLKRLRGTWLDPFGRSEERQSERMLIGDYTDLIDSLLPRLDRANAARIVAIAELPHLIRGFGLVKAAGIAQYRSEKFRLCAELIEETRLAA